MTEKHIAETGEKRLTVTKIAELIGITQVWVSALLDGRMAGGRAGVLIEAATKDWSEGPIACKEWFDAAPPQSKTDDAAGNGGAGEARAVEDELDAPAREPIAESAPR